MFKKRLFLFLGLSLFGAGVLFSKAFFEGNCRMNVDSLPKQYVNGVDALFGHQWLTFSNDYYNYTFEFDRNWRLLPGNISSFNESETANQSIYLLSPDDELVTVFTWDNKEKLSLVDWYNKYQVQLLTGVEIPEKPNAKISGEDAILVIEPRNPQQNATVSLVFLNRNSVFRLEYEATNRGSGLGEFKHLLGSFKFRKKQGSDISSSFPEIDLTLLN
ncbi:MAG TPA: hypothetical protein VMW29_01285 [Candidatus Bathyarchaeia archaeon]|nr:hypothetical protein [Candidatus Bathyarchaeia archaeon]